MDYYSMTNSEKEIFDKQQSLYKKDVDYFNADFDQRVKAQMQAAKLSEMNA